MFLADTLSRHHLASTTSIKRDEKQAYQLSDAHELFEGLEKDDNPEELKEETDADPSLQEVKKFILSGWPANPKTLDPTMKPYFHVRDELGVLDGLVFRGDRLVIPKDVEKADVARATLSPSRN